MASDIELQAQAIESAKAVIAKHESDDFLLEPEAHIQAFRASAPELASLLEKLDGITKQYVRRDKQAIAAQNSFKRAATTANAAIMVAGIASALLMAAEILSAVPAGGTTPVAPELAALVRPFGVISALSAAVATAALFVSRSGNFLENWMEKRALAETARLKYFTALTSEPKPANLDLQTLEYFRRFQCDLQEAFYERRGEKHRRSALLTMSFAVVGVFVSALAGGGVIVGQNTAYAAVAVVGAAISAFAAAREAITQDSRNAERYDRALETLHDIVGTRLQDVRKAVAAGDHALLVEFVSAVNEQLSLEHRQWLESSEATKEGLTKLDAALAAAGKKREE